MKLFKRNLISASFNPKTEDEPIYDRFVSNQEKKLIPDDVMLEVSRKFGDGINWNVEELKHDSSINERIMQNLLAQRAEERNEYLNGVFQPEQPKPVTLDDILSMRLHRVDKRQIETIDGEPPVWYVAPNVYQLLIKHICDNYEMKSTAPMTEEGIIYGGFRIKPKACLPDNTYVTNIKCVEDET